MVKLCHMLEMRKVDKAKCVSTQKKQVMIVGCGKVGSFLAQLLLKEGCDLMIIDSQESAFHRLPPDFTGSVTCGDATDHGTLIEAKIKKTEMLIAATNDDLTNIYLAQVAREIYHVTKVIARLCEAQREEIYKEFEIKTISPSVLAAEAFRDEVGS